MKKNKNLIFLLLIAIIGVVGITIAYFSNSTSITNEFGSSEYGTDVTETFTSPTGWQPGDETPKVLTVKNTGEVDEAVRIKVEEKWVNKNGQELPLTQDGNVAAQINYINSSDWTRVDVANEDYYYYYYNYKLSPDEETSELLDKVTFNPLIGASTTCTDSIGANGETIRSCTSNGSGYDGATYTLKFTIETVQYNKYQQAWNTEFAIAEEKPHPGTLTLLEKTNPVSITNYTDGNIHEMYTFEHEETAQTPALTDYRYIGNDPYNYVYFNCDSLDNQNSETCEVWRIIGVFDVEREIDDEENPGEKKTITETRMKLVRGNLLRTNMSWDTNGKTDWTISSLKSFLNDDYYNRKNDALTYGLKESSRKMVENAKFYLGTVDSSSTILWGSTTGLYEKERGNRSDSFNQSVIEKISLIYISDNYLTYALGVDSKCYNYPSYCSTSSTPAGAPSKGWIYKSGFDHMWFLDAGRSYVALTSYEGPINNTPPSNKGGVRPTLYLSADVKIIDGDGSSGNPYKLK